MTTTAGDQIRPFHAEAATAFPILPSTCIIDEDPEPGAGFGQTHMNGLNPYGVPRYECQKGYVVSRHRGLHEAGHAFIAELYYYAPIPLVGLDWRERAWKYLGYANTYAQQLADANAQTSPAAVWNSLPEERIVEAFASCLDGVQLQGVPTPAALREFFAAMMYEARPSTKPAPRPPVIPPVPPAPPAPPPIVAPPPAAGVALRVLWHLSHHSSSRPDGWSGAPDEARFIREDLTPRVASACRAFGIELVLVDGDLANHPAFGQDYLAFIAPHYESDTHDDHPDADTGANTRGGWFWGRAAASSSAAEDDRLGATFERRYRALLAKYPAGPDEHEDWMTVNVTAYYGFNYTTAKTPGILTELGVGAPGDPNNDHDWLRAHVDEIAHAYALALIEFAGGPVPAEEEDMTPDELNRAIDKRINESPDLQNTITAIKGALEGQNGAIVKLANDETLDDADVAALKSRIDKLRNI